MDKRINVIQFLAYFPPHKGGVEDVAMEFSKNYVSEGCGDVLNVVFSVGQPEGALDYEKDGYWVVVIPAFDIVPNFPFPKFWTRGFWRALSIAKKYDAKIIQTHTRFFLSTTLGGLCAKLWGRKWVHVEHGSGFTVSDQWKVRFFSKLFDYTLGKLTFAFCDRVVAISEACKRFINEQFTNKPVEVVYRGMDFDVKPRIPASDNKIRLTFVGRLTMLKGVHILLEAIRLLVADGISNFHLRIIGDGEERDNLEKYVAQNNLTKYISFLGALPKEQVHAEILPSTDILINPSLQEGLPTTVLEGLMAGCQVIATDVGGTREITEALVLHIIPSDSSIDLASAISEEVSHDCMNSGVIMDLNDKFSWKASCHEYYSIYSYFYE